MYSLAIGDADEDVTAPGGGDLRVVISWTLAFVEAPLARLGTGTATGALHPCACAAAARAQHTVAQTTWPS